MLVCVSSVWQKINSIYVCNISTYVRIYERIQVFTYLFERLQVCDDNTYYVYYCVDSKQNSYNLSRICQKIVKAQILDFAYPRSFTINLGWKHKMVLNQEAATLVKCKQISTRSKSTSSSQLLKADKKIQNYCDYYCDSQKRSAKLILVNV